MTHALTRPAARSGADFATGWRRALIIPVLLAEFALAFAAAVRPTLAFTFILGGVVLLAALIRPVPVLVLAFPAAYGYWRVGPSALDMSLTDAFTILATVAALPWVPWRSKQLRGILVIFGFYVATVAVSVLASPSTAAAGEIFHRLLMVAGPLLIGAALASVGKARLALRAFVLVSIVVAVAAVVDTVTKGLTPAYPFGMHKNAAGAHIVSALLVLLAASPRVGFRRGTTIAISATLFAGLLATQSRGAAIAMVAAAAFYLLRSRNRRLARAAPLVLLVALISLVLLTFSISSLAGSPEDDAAARFDSYNTRIDAYTYALENAWKPHIPFGSGPKWFRLDTTFSSGPHNLVVAELSETGLMGLAALLAFLGYTFVLLWRIRSDLGDAALLVLLERILDSMVGILWVAGTGTLPWMVVGLALGDDHRATDDEAVAADEEPVPSPVRR